MHILNLNPRIDCLQWHKFCDNQALPYLKNVYNDASYLFIYLI